MTTAIREGRDNSMQTPVVEEAVKQMLVAVRNHCEITAPLNSEPLDEIVDGITDAIWTLYDIELQPEECNDGFMDCIFDFLQGNINWDECLDGLSRF